MYIFPEAEKFRQPSTSSVTEYINNFIASPEHVMQKSVNRKLVLRYSNVLSM